MVNINKAFGFKPVRVHGGYSDPIKNEYVLRNDTVSTTPDDLYYGDLVQKNSAGEIVQCPAASTDDVLGVFAGCKYKDSNGKSVFANNFVGGLAGKVTDLVGFVYDDPKTVFEVQANAAIPQNLLYTGFNIDNVTTSATDKFGQSSETIVSASGTTVKVEVIGFPKLIDNNLNQTFNIVEVMINPHLSPS